MSLSDFDILSQIGEGAYSKVFKARRRSDNKIYAVKIVKIRSLSDKEKKNALNEIRIMASIKNSNVISYKEAFFDEKEESLCLIMEYADSGDLWQRIQKSIKRSVRMSEKFIWSMFIQLTNGLKALHDLGVFHRDLKSANVFLNRDGTVKLGDMNVSKVSKDGFLRTQTGTPYYASPEVWKDMKYDNKSDIWSLGCVLYESLMLKPPFRANDMNGLYEKVVNGEFEPIPKYYSKDIMALIKILLNSDPIKRPTCDEILELDLVRRHMPNKNLSTSRSSLINPIKVPRELSMLSFSLPRPEYCFESLNHYNSEKLPRASHDNSSKNLKLPHIKLNKHNVYKRLANNYIEASSDRLKRIREIYLSPTNVILTPQVRKMHNRVRLKKEIFS